VLAPEGVRVGDTIQVGVSAEIKPGNTLPLAEIPEGVPVCNVESNRGDGGKFARASGVSATLLTHDRDVAVVQLPSGEVKRLDPQCRATIGVVAGGGRTEKPFVKAGNKYHKMKARGTKYPRARRRDERRRPPLRWGRSPTPPASRSRSRGTPRRDERSVTSHPSAPDEVATNEF